MDDGRLVAPSEVPPVQEAVLYDLLLQFNVTGKDPFVRIVEVGE